MRWSIILSILAVSGLVLGSITLGEESPARHRSPMDLAVLPATSRALTANHSADTVSLLDLGAGKVLAEQAVGRKPSAVACSRDAKRAAVSNLWSGTVMLLEVHDDALKVVAEVATGPLPRGVVFAPDGQTLYVAVAGADEIVQLDWDTKKIVHRWPAPREPRRLALSSDGRSLAAASSRSAQVRCWDTQTKQQLWERTVGDGFNLHGLTFAPGGKELVCPHSIRRSFPVAKHNIEEGWVIDSRLSRFALAAEARPASWQIALDLRHEAVGDPHGVAFSPDGRWLAVTGSGTHELILFETAVIPWNAGEPGDFMDVSLEIGPHKMRRINLGGRPLNVAFLDNNTVAVANYLQDAVQVVDVKAGKLARSVSLGAPAEPSLARRGEALFYDAQRSTGQWFSCHTCHVDGHTTCMTFDTLNDDSYGNPKLTPTLHNVTKTGPWTWHGWQDDLAASVEKSMTETMFGPKPAADDVKAMLAYLATLEPSPNPHRGANGSVSAAAQRGKEIFNGKARCARCHKGDLYTAPGNYDVKLEPDGSPYDLWNPPSLLGLWDRGPYLHDARSDTLEDLLRVHHSSEKLGGQRLTDQERQDLIEFLKSL